MSRRNRKDARLKYHHLYQRHQHTTRCHYCGDNHALTEDHVPPLSMVAARGVDFFTERGVGLWLVKACTECNTILGDKPLISLDRRIAFIYEELQKRYKNLLSQPEWDEDELEELDESLQDYIEQSEYLRRWIEKRLQWMEDVHYEIV